jgi:hypothetical protein
MWTRPQHHADPQRRRAADRRRHRAALVEACGGTRLALLTIVLPDPTGYGRIVRAGGSADGACSASSSTRTPAPAQRQIREVYTGMMAAPTALLKRWVMALKNDNAQKEYYLTDIVAMAVAEGVPVVASQAADETEVLGVNSPLQLADLERRFQRRQAEALMEAGVRLADPARFDLRGSCLRAGCRDRRRLRLRRHGRAGRRRAHRRALRDPRRGDRQRRGDPPLHPHRGRRAWVPGR